MADPFDCFGSDDDDDDDGSVHSDETESRVDPSSSPSAESRRRRHRPDDCDVLSFHPGTEAALLAHVRNAVVGGGGGGGGVEGGDYLSRAASPAASFSDPSKTTTTTTPAMSPAATVVLDAIDDFCRTRHWMMHVGPEKAGILREELIESARDFFVAAADGDDRRSSSEDDGDGDGDGDEGDEGRRRTGLDRRRRRRLRRRRRRNRFFVCAELGTYCGYSSVLMADALRAVAAEAKETSAAKDDGDDDGDGCIDFHLYTLEVNREYAAVAGEMLALSGLTDVVTQILLPLDTVEGGPGVADILTDEISRREENTGPPPSSSNTTTTTTTTMEAEAAAAPAAPAAEGSGIVPAVPPPRVDFLFVDHDKDMYLPDLRALEEGGMIRAGTTAAADNVIFARIDDYVVHVRELARDGTAATRTVPAGVEYSAGGVEHFKDGMEITTYLADP